MALLQKLVYHLTIKPRLNKLKRLLPEASIHPTGSRYVCSPPVMFTDIDFLIYTEVSIAGVLILTGYKESEITDKYNGLTLTGDFQAWRKGNINLIVTSSRKYAETFHTATHICKLHNVRVKFDRIIVHETLRGNDPKLIGSRWFPTEMNKLLGKFKGEHGASIHMAYRAKHGLVL